MTSGTGPMAELRARLGGGVLNTVRANRPDGSTWSDREAFGDLAEVTLPAQAASPLPDVTGPIRLPDLLARIRDTPGPAPAAVTGMIDALTALLSRNRPLLLGVLFSPDLLLDRLPDLTREDGDVEKQWAALCWISEAAWDSVAAHSDRRLLTPLAARLRFLVLSEPMRHRADGESPWTRGCVQGRPGPHGVYGAVFGDDAWFELVSRCREARWEWQAHLDAHQSAPLLAQAGAAELEDELGLLAFRAGGSGRPLVLSPAPLDEHAAVGADDRAVIAEVAERHLLPRFQLGRVMALVAASPARFAAALAVLPLVPAGAALGLAGCGHFTAAARSALGCYAVLGLAALLGGPRVAAPWLLRIPAASAVGVLVVITLHPTWWHVPKAGWGTPAALLGLSFGYLVVEVRNHGVGAGRAVARASAVTVVGTLHALLVSLAGLVIIAPAYAERPDNGPRIADWFTADAVGRSWHLLALAAACSLAVGVFSQILWEDRPITASLAHVEWRSGR